MDVFKRPFSVATELGVESWGDDKFVKTKRRKLETVDTFDLTTDASITGDLTVTGNTTITGTVEASNFDTNTNTNNVLIGRRNVLNPGASVSNVIVGSDILTDVTAPSHCVLIGDGAGEFSAGNTNVYIGSRAGSSVDLFSVAANDAANVGGGNVCIGFNACNLIGSGSNNSVYGNGAGSAVTSGFENVIVGQDAGRFITSGSNNIIVGRDCAQLLTDGTENIIIGSAFTPASATRTLDIGTVITCDDMNIGIIKMDDVDTITSTNMTIGASTATSVDLSAAGKNTNVVGNLTVAEDSTVSGTTSSNSTITGALVVSGGVGIAENLNVGGTICAAGLDTGDASNNAFLGTSAGGTGAGARNTCIGVNAGDDLTSGNDNVALGYNTFASSGGSSAGDRNTVIGASSGDVIVGSGQGNDNCLMGYDAGGLLTFGNRNIGIGSGSLPACTSGSDNLVIGNGAGAGIAATTNNQLRIGSLISGDFSTNNVTLAGDLILTPITVPTAVEGSIYYDSGLNKLRFYNGTAWEIVTSV